MALQTSGAISLSQIQTEYGGANPISMSEYYRYGTYVPGTINVTSNVTGYQPTSGYAYNSTTDYWYEFSGYASFISYTIRWAGTNVYSSSRTDNISSYSVGGWTYYQGTSVYSGYYWNIRRYGTYSTTTSTTVNGSVPTGGAISLSNFYGGRKT